MTDPLAEALDLIEHLNMDPEGRIIPLLLADIAQSLRSKTTTKAVRDDDDWPARKGWSASGNTWLCPEPGCGFGISGLLTRETAFDELDPVGEHMTEHEAEQYPALASLSSPPTVASTWECPACHFRGPQALTEPSLVTLDRADELVGEVRRWREADRIFPPESAEWWDATDRFRDVADRIGGTL